MTTRYQQILKDRGGRLVIRPTENILRAHLTVKSDKNQDLTTAISNDAASIVSREIQFAAAAAAGDTTITLAETKGLRTWVPYQLTNGYGEGEPVRLTRINAATGVCAVAGEGLQFAYRITNEEDVLREIQAIYDISTSLAAAQGLGTAYRADWRLVLGENEGTIQSDGSDATKVNLTSALSALCYVGGTVVVHLDSPAADEFEERTIASISGDEITVHQAFSSTPLTGDPVFPLARIKWEEQLFDIVRQVLECPLTSAIVTSRWPSIRDLIWQEADGSEYQEQIALAWSDVLSDLIRAGKRPHLIKGGADFMVNLVWYRFRLNLAVDGGIVSPLGSQMGLTEHLEDLRTTYATELREVLKTFPWEDLNENNVREPGEAFRPLQARRHR